MDKQFIMTRFKPFMLFLASILAVGCSGLHSSSEKEADRLIFFNVENLYDTIDDARVNDNEFLPASAKKWTADRYQKKLEGISRTLCAEGIPLLAGLAEVENAEVLRALTKEAVFCGQLGFLHLEGKDPRGIECALLYDSSRLRPVFIQRLQVDYPGHQGPGGRDILYATMINASKDSLHLFINHWKSRIEGENETRSRRIIAARVLREKIDSLFKVHPDPAVVIMGDFNDEPGDSSMQILMDPGGSGHSSSLINLMLQASMRGEGSYSFRGRWEMLDQILVSRALLQKNSSIQLLDPEGKVLRKDFLLRYVDKAGEEVPYKTYAGDQYMGGISDHLPVCILLKPVRKKAIP